MIPVSGPQTMPRNRCVFLIPNTPHQVGLKAHLYIQCKYPLHPLYTQCIIDYGKEIIGRQGNTAVVGAVGLCRNVSTDRR